MVLRTIGYRCQFKCQNLIGVFRTQPPKPTHTIYGSVYEYYWRCSYCDIWLLRRIYCHSNKCPCCNRNMRSKGRYWNRMWGKQIKYIE